MRDILICLLVFGALPFILWRPFFGVMVWTWLGLMNPHRLAWGFSLDLPFALIVFLTTVFSLLMSRESKKIPLSREIVLLLIFVVWMFLTTLLSWFPQLAWEQWDKVWKIQLGVILTLMLVTNRERIHLLVWTICVSLGFYGFKGGLWTVATGGTNRVYGPDGTFIGGNNEIGLALIMIVPLLWYLILHSSRKWVKMGHYVVLACSIIAIVGTHSRGDLLGLLVMGAMFLLKSRRKLIPLITAALFIAVLPYIAPDEWFERMDTIQDFESDRSAQGRLGAWRKSIEIANSSPTGGGYEVLQVVNGTDAHSIYFEILGEQGYPGLLIFLALGLCTWLKAGAVKRRCKQQPELVWARDLATMIQTSLVGYGTAGAFLGLGYFDLIYVIMVLTVMLHRVVEQSLGRTSPALAVRAGRAAAGVIPRRVSAAALAARRESEL
jgi:probable O-glycosylation ligase (exosortase A-associated)